MSYGYHDGPTDHHDYCPDCGAVEGTCDCAEQEEQAAYGEPPAGDPPLDLDVLRQLDAQQRREVA